MDSGAVVHRAIELTVLQFAVYQAIFHVGGGLIHCPG